MKKNVLFPVVLTVLSSALSFAGDKLGEDESLAPKLVLSSLPDKMKMEDVVEAEMLRTSKKIDEIYSQLRKDIIAMFKEKYPDMDMSKYER